MTKGGKGSVFLQPYSFLCTMEKCTVRIPMIRQQSWADKQFNAFTSCSYLKRTDFHKSYCKLSPFLSFDSFFFLKSLQVWVLRESKEPNTTSLHLYTFTQKLMTICVASNPDFVSSLLAVRKLHRRPCNISSRDVCYSLHHDHSTEINEVHRWASTLFSVGRGPQRAQWCKLT